MHRQWYLNYNLGMESVAIQAGGESRRMGQDKALLDFLGKPLIEHVIQRVSMLGEEILITTNKPDDYVDFKLPLFQDVLPGNGALGGLYTALYAAQFPIVIVVACDMPFVNVDILRTAVRTIVSGDSDVVIPKTRNGFEPLHAVYRRKTCLPAVRAAIDRGEKRLISWFSEVELTQIDEAQIAALDPQRIAFMNLNTREDFEIAETIARENN
jgi:molybdopterin-guanine dinucleotide biosynthesis protein A